MGHARATATTTMGMLFCIVNLYAEQCEERVEIGSRQDGRRGEEVREIHCVTQLQIEGNDWSENCGYMKACNQMAKTR